jgi:hypothetical protein
VTGELPLPALFDERGEVVRVAIGKDRADELNGMAWALFEEHQEKALQLIDEGAISG